MTEVDEIVIKNFESKLIRLMEAHTALAHENMQLRERLAHQSVELDEAREQYAIPEYTADLMGTRIHEILCKPSLED